MEAKTKPSTAVSPTYLDFEPYGEWKREEGREMLTLDLPGFKKEELKVQVSNQGGLKISGEHPINEDGTQRKRFYKETRVPVGCEINQIRAMLINGRLQIIMPKKISPVQSETQPQPELGMISTSDTARLRVGKKMGVSIGAAVLAIVAIGAYAVYRYKSSSSTSSED
ncbi:hypothetical protein Ancab_015128 [Ancistrocladus abbreviatus]